MMSAVFNSHQIFTLNNDTILTADDTLNHPTLAFIFAPYYHNLLQRIHTYETMIIK